VSGCVEKKASASTTTPQRIISLAPSITETLFALGLGERVVGVTSYCKYPPQVESLAKVGGYSDANIEQIYSLHPDLVVLSPEHEKQRMALEQFGVIVVVVRNQTINDITQSFVTIAHACGVSKKSDSLSELFQLHFNQYIRPMHSSPRVLISIGRDHPGSGRVSSAYAVGPKTFYHEVISAAGGQNAIIDSALSYPRLSVEGIISTRPDIIIDIASPMGANACSLMIHDWSSIEHLEASSKNNVFCIAKDYATLPGPRLVRLKQEIQSIISNYSNRI